ncbi:MAG TPA: DNA-directed RNA polymerase subunit omega [Fimbriimonadaceae bacterium]|nr:DNA-directed RNA polymerase subunit omega [Fimbriimonadaceae bacterium]HRJ96993.1 DNA-directed RNA polymerase subunit omega [Fimbriimonadaceae bacterium]
MTPSSGSILPSADILNDFEQGKFVLSNLAAKRAKQLKEGAPPLVRVESNHPLTIALAEIAAGKIRPKLGTEEPVAVESDVTIISDEPIVPELGILLPALDEAEAELLVADEHDEGEHDLEEEPEIDLAAATLTDLLDEAEPEPEPVPVDGEEATLSLSDIADQENLDEDEEAVD